MNPRRTKIIATLGPATDTPLKLERLLDAGVDLIRLNFSHGHHTEHLHNIELIRSWSQKHNRHIGIIADLQRPKIRVTEIANSPINLKKGDTINIDLELKSKGTKQSIGIDYPNIKDDLKIGDVLLLDDGFIKLTIVNINNHIINCQIENDGSLASYKGINKLGGGLSTPSFTKKDSEDLEFAIKQDVDYIAVSFVKDQYDLEKIKKIIQDNNSNARTIAKIERFEAIDNLDEIIKTADAVMVARGDLGIEVGIDKVPFLQKLIISKARDLNKPVITATQIMESMIVNTIPTRAEVSDIANAVLDSTDAIMFSAETATGKHPDLVVKAAAKICLSSEENPMTSTSQHRIESRFERTDEAIAMGAMYIANHQNIQAIITLTETGSTPCWMSRIKSNIPIYAISEHIHTVRAMNLFRDVYPILFDYGKLSLDDINKKAMAYLREQHFVKPGDLVILTHGNKIGDMGKTNTLKIESIK